MTVPNWYELLLLALAAFRVYRLIGRDTILDPVRKWAVGLPANWQDGDPVPRGYREKLAIFLQCPWCAGFWMAVAWWAAWEAWPRWTLIVAVPWVVSALVALAAKNLDD